MILAKKLLVIHSLFPMFVLLGHGGCPHFLAALRSLLDVARARADLMARGLSPELEDIYSIAAAPR